MKQSEGLQMRVFHRVINYELLRRATRTLRAGALNRYAIWSNQWIN